jgi:hypothetical protein
MVFIRILKKHIVASAYFASHAIVGDVYLRYRETKKIRKLSLNCQKEIYKFCFCFSFMWPVIVPIYTALAYVEETYLPYVLYTAFMYGGFIVWMII